MDISISEAHNRLTHWLKQVEKGEIVRITRRGVPIGVLIAPEDYERLRQVQVYLEMIRISRSLQNSDTSAQELHPASRDDLDGHI